MTDEELLKQAEEAYRDNKHDVSIAASLLVIARNSLPKQKKPVTFKEDSPNRGIIR